MTDSNNLPPVGDGEASFSGLGDKSIRVQVLLDADEFLSVRDLSAARGISQSSYFRQLHNEERKRIAQEELSKAMNSANTHGVTQNLRSEDLNALADLVAQRLKAAA